MNRHAVLAGTENGVLAVKAVARGAPATRGALVALGEGGLHEVRTTGALQQVSPHGGHVSELRGGPAEDGVRHHRVLHTDKPVVGQRAVRHTRLDEHPARVGRRDRRERESSQIDKGRGLFDAALHQVEEIRPPGEVSRSMRCGVDRIVDSLGMPEGEGLHAV